MPSEAATDKTSTTKTIGGRANDDQIRIIDLAAAIQRLTRGEFLVEMAHKAAVDTIQKKAPELLQTLKTA